MNVELDGQYRALREEAGFARRERGWISVEGPDAAEYLQGQLTNDIDAIEAGHGAYAALLDRKGHMQADMRILRLDGERFLIEVEPTAHPASIRHLTMYSVGRDVAVEDRFGALTLVSVAGPGTAERTGLAPLRSEHDHEQRELDGIEVRAVRTDLGLDLVADRDRAEAVERTLEGRDVVRVSEDALEILRVEAGRPRYGREMTPETIPQEAGINERAVSFTKGCYIGQETVARLHYRGKPNRHLRGLRLTEAVDDGAPVSLGERELGRIGTAVLSPALGPIALAILRREAGPGDAVTVGAGVTGTIVELPFEDLA